MADTNGTRLANYTFRKGLKEYSNSKPQKQETKMAGLLQRTKPNMDKPKEDTFLYDLAMSIRNS